MLRLRIERKKRNWSLIKVTQLTGISPTDLSYMERGLKHVFPGWKKRLSEAFDLPEEKLFEEVEEESA